MKNHPISIIELHQKKRSGCQIKMPLLNLATPLDRFNKTSSDVLLSDEYDDQAESAEGGQMYRLFHHSSRIIAPRRIKNRK